MVSAEYGMLREAQFDFSAPTDGGDAPAPGADAEKKDDPIDKLVGDLKSAIRERALSDLRGEIGKGEAAKTQKVIDENENDSIIKSAFRHPSWKGVAHTVLAMTRNDPKKARKILLGLIHHKAGGWKAVAEARLLTGREILAVSRVLDHTVRRASVAGEARIYRTVVTVGGVGSYHTANEYLQACRNVIGRDLTHQERVALLHKGRLFALGS
jgi:hypothetical protein